MSCWALSLPALEGVSQLLYFVGEGPLLGVFSMQSIHIE